MKESFVKLILYGASCDKGMATVNLTLRRLNLDGKEGATNEEKTRCISRNHVENAWKAPKDAHLIVKGRRKSELDERCAGFRRNPAR